MTTGPGTVSKILWHFTGGPSCGQSHRKAPEDAYAALRSILESCELRVSYEPQLIKQRRSAPDFVTVQKQETARVACVAEIPIQHLDHHARVYGEFAIGFHRSAALEAGFRPVIYALVDDWTIKQLMDGGDEKLLSLVKTFDQSEFETTYAEREWRCRQAFRFELSQVAMLVLPREYRARLIEDIQRQSHEVPIIAYEDLLQH